MWPSSKLPESDLPSIDKLVHVLLFCGWTIAIINDFKLKWYTALTAGLIFAVFTEVIQIPTEDRTFDLNDVAADGAGVILGLLSAQFVIRITRKLLRR